MNKKTNDIIEFYKELHFNEDQYEILKVLYDNKSFEEKLDNLISSLKVVQNDKLWLSNC